ncbi:xylulokinase [Duganella sp. CF517]|uniref:xylulokinase n=1 Tax=Duganella sp. CF517 TaxID=1881038 RepID=UPI0008CD62EF|nr:xylulokinase [Duganella sp. CF517]SEO64875.1 xylulokinase [Duganella sp. CF517]
MYLGIDLGTSEVKVLLIDAQQRTVASAHAPLAISRPMPQWSEQDPADWWQATKTALHAIAGSHPRDMAALRGIGLSGQMHGTVLLDAAGRVLRPAILWNDTRAGAECAELERRAPELRRITGNLAMPGFSAPKLLWVARHEPALFDRIATVLLPKDYLRYLLTGEFISDMSDASGTLWLDVALRDWSDTMLEACGLSRSHMPRLVEGTAPGGMLRAELAREWGIPAPVVVAGGAGDNAASAVGMGVVAPGDSFISLGTSGVFFAASDAYRPDPAQGLHTFCHALPGQWHQMGVMLSAASCLRWVTALTHAADEKVLLEEIERAGPSVRATAPLFLPYLSGERTPHNDPLASGVWFGLRHDTDRAALGYSVLEGVAFGLRDSYLALRGAGGDVRTAALVGGGSRSRYWARLLASVLDVPLTLNSGAHVGAALGAARLAMLAADTGLDVARVCVAPPVLEVIPPEPDWRAALLPRHERFGELYRKVQPLF